jgi:hypothetical protein
MNVAGDASTDFLSRLEAAIALRAAWLESTRIPLLKEMLGTYRSLIESLTGTLIKKGLLREDPYAPRDKIVAMVAPPDTAILEGDEDAEVGRRIFAYRRQLGFLVDGLKYTLPAMNAAALKGILALVGYVDWESFGEGSHSPTTRAFARLVTQVLVSKDGLSSQVLHDSQVKIVKLARDIREAVGELEAWHRESWKAEVRAKVLPQVSPQPPKSGEERTARVLAIRKAFEHVLSEGTWQQQLAVEILGEDQPPGSAERMEKLLTSLAIPRMVVSSPEEATKHRAELLAAVRAVCAAAAEIDYCEEALGDNQRAIEKRSLGFFQRILRWFRRNRDRPDGRCYDIQHESKTESINFLRFVSEMKELKVVLAEIGQAGTPASARIEAMDEEQLCDFLDWQLRQLRRLHPRMEGLNELFQLKAANDGSSPPRSIKLALLAIENLVARANTVRRDSIARLERAHTAQA